VGFCSPQVWFLRGTSDWTGKESTPGRILVSLLPLRLKVVRRKPYHVICWWHHLLPSLTNPSTPHLASQTLVTNHHTVSRQRIQWALDLCPKHRTNLPKIPKPLAHCFKMAAWMRSSHSRHKGHLNLRAAQPPSRTQRALKPVYYLHLETPSCMPFW
jgi:hypothetical protein